MAKRLEEPYEPFKTVRGPLFDRNEEAGAADELPLITGLPRSSGAGRQDNKMDRKTRSTGEREEKNDEF